MKIQTPKSKIQKERWALTLAMIIGIFTLNLLASRHFLRLDLTHQKIYTLARATKDILKGLEDVVTIRLYFTPDLPPELTSLRKDVEDVLSEFKTYAGNHIKVEYHNPQETPIKEQQVQMMGIPPIEVNVIAKDKQELAKIYLGMSVNFLNKSEVLAVVQNTGNLEYRLAAAILKVTNPKRPAVAWWGPSVAEGETDPLKEKLDGYEMAFERLKQRYDVRVVSEKLDALDPKEVPTLLFVVPEKLTEEQKKAFTDYMAKGGKPIILLDRVTVAMAQGLKPTPMENPLEEFLKSYGVEVKQDLVLDRSNAMATFTGGIISYHLPYPYWVLIRPEGFDKTQPMVSELNSLILPWSSSLEITQPLPEGTSVTPLFKTTQFGVTSSFNPATSLDPQVGNNAIATGKAEVIPLSVMITKKGKEGLDTQMVVLGNAKLFQNSFLQQFEENGIFLENAVDAFSTGNQLIGVRSKGMTNQPLGIISDARRTTIKLVDLFISPLLLISLGVLILFWRRSKARQLQALYASKTP